MVKAVVFDLDDTLISEKQYVESGFHHISKLMNSQYDISEEFVFNDLMNLFRESSKNVFNRLLNSYEIESKNEKVVELVAEYRNHQPEISFYSDVLPYIEHLKSLGIKIGIITDGYAVTQRKKLEAVQAYDYFDEIIITDELGQEFSKPHNKSFEIMREKLKVEFDEMVYVGDNPEKDFYISSIHPLITVRINRCGIYADKDYHMGVKELVSIKELSNLDSIIK